MITRRELLALLGAALPASALGFGESSMIDIAEIDLGSGTLTRPNAWKRLLYEVVHTTSTAQAAFMLTRSDADWDAAISAPVAAEHYRLVTLAAGIADNPDALTRFVLVSRPGPPPPPTGMDKTSLVAFMRDDHPGALMEILEQLTMRGVNMTRIESRPTGAALGNYCFSIDCEGHIEDARVGEALMGLHRVCADVRFLGSYERHDGVAPTIRAGTSDREFLDAQSWLARLRNGG